MRDQKGHGVINDDFESVKCDSLVVEEGDISAEIYRGIVQYTNQDYPEALKWFTLAAEHGKAHAHSCLGVMYYQGEGVMKDDSEAVKWFTLAAEQGHELSKEVLNSKFDSNHL